MCNWVGNGFMGSCNQVLILSMEYGCIGLVCLLSHLQRGLGIVRHVLLGLEVAQYCMQWEYGFQAIA